MCIPRGTFVEIKLRVGNVGPVTTQVDGTRMLNKHPSGKANPSGLVPRSVIVFDLALDRSCAASIITRRSWYGIVIISAVLKWHRVSVDSRIAIGPYHL